ncbi:MAG: hypothetical protein KAT00_09860, partial [Planctomycetes bacterium]|nr:hypothetical protein [Planctomycetota bacterium]
MARFFWLKYAKSGAKYANVCKSVNSVRHDNCFWGFFLEKDNFALALSTIICSNALYEQKKRQKNKRKRPARVQIFQETLA